MTYRLISPFGDLSRHGMVGMRCHPHQKKPIVWSTFRASEVTHESGTKTYNCRELAHFLVPLGKRLEGARLRSSHALSSSIHYNMVTWSLRTADKAFQRSLEKIFQTLSKMETVQSNRISFKTVALDEQ